MKKNYKYIIYIFGLVVLISLFSGGSEKIEDKIASSNSNSEQYSGTTLAVDNSTDVNLSAVKTRKDNLYSVVKVVDGDTIDVSIDGKVERLRLIGINTPETVDPRKPVECFGVEASNKAKSVLSGKKVSIENDSSQGERDKYERLLRYVFLEDGTNFNLLMIKEGYAYEYTYDLPYKYQAEFKEAQKYASDKKSGLWGTSCEKTEAAPVSSNPTTAQTTASPSSCSIKGNISSGGEKIYHVEDCGSYNATKIDEARGEKWFCSEQEALNAGWRKALNCE